MDWLLSMWQWVCGFSRLEWIVMVGFFLIFLVMDVGGAARANCIYSELTLIRRVLEGLKHDEAKVEHYQVGIRRLEQLAYLLTTIRTELRTQNGTPDYISQEDHNHTR